MARQPKSHVETYVIMPKKVWGWRIAFSMLVLLLSLVGGHWYWGAAAEDSLDAYVQSMRDRGVPLILKDFRQAAVEYDQNAAIPLAQAAVLVDDRFIFDQFYSTQLLPPLIGEEQYLVVRAVDANTDALRKLREAGTRSRAAWHMPWSLEWNLRKGEIMLEQAYLAELARAALLLAHARGDHCEAAKMGMDLLRQAKAVAQAPGGVSRQNTTSSLWRDAALVLSRIAPDLRVGDSSLDATPDAVRELIRELLDESPVRDGMVSAITWQRAMDLEKARAIQRGDERLYWCACHRPGKLQLAFEGYVNKASMLNDARVLVEHATAVLAAAENSCDWPEYQYKAQETENAMWQLKQNSGLRVIGFSLDPSYKFQVQWTYQALTESRLAAVALAVRLYSLEHDGKMPSSLASLAPEYLPEAPRDPMGSGRRALGYVPDARTPVVYSVGENGHDDGGSEAPTVKSTKLLRWETEDVIVHLKR
jgi:hypothetical protein